MILDTPDDYERLYIKSYEAIRQVYSAGYTHFFYCDDDCYVHPDRLLKSGFSAHDYIGAWILGEDPIRERTAIWYRSQSFCPTGCGVWLSQKAMEILLDNPPPEEHDDHWIGWTLRDNGVRPITDSRYFNYSCFANPKNFRYLSEYTGDTVFPTEQTVISVCEFNPEEMIEHHRKVLAGERFFPRWVPPVPVTEITAGGITFKNPA
jgi:hypothetical protein